MVTTPADQINGNLQEGSRGWQSFNWLIIGLVTMSISSQGGDIWCLCHPPPSLPYPGRLSLHPSSPVKYCWQKIQAAQKSANFSAIADVILHCDHPLSISLYLQQQTAEVLPPNIVFSQQVKMTRQDKDEIMAMVRSPQSFKFLARSAKGRWWTKPSSLWLPLQQRSFNHHQAVLLAQHSHWVSSPPTRT